MSANFDQLRHITKNMQVQQRCCRDKDK